MIFNTTSSVIFLDLDGTLADFDGHFRSLFDLEPSSVDSKEKWALIAQEVDFFATMPVLPGAVEFYNMIRHRTHAVLTGCPHTEYARAATNKRHWSRTHLDENIMALPVLGKRNKHLFINRPGDYLIDDNEEVCANWTNAGGRAILFDGDYEKVLTRLTNTWRP